MFKNLKSVIVYEQNLLRETFKISLWNCPTLKMSVMQYCDTIITSWFLSHVFHSK